MSNKLDMSPVTAWQLFNKDTMRWEHNHIEDGHCPNGRPTPKVPEHKRIWARQQWIRVYGHLVGKDKVWYTID